ncbi:PilW family protein [Mangrovitalea sediminis]|uniref:PilW family protein n=1 Tax=Mangrovitalea sediminis TaxID=1982043 RepID=UPI000BE56B47|nr:PilW family protein [Mangrovitalea sediminis]
MQRNMQGLSLNQQGLSLVELMIALVLGLIISLGVINIFIQSKNTYQTQDAISQVQENARFALDFLARDIRMAGYTGCAQVMSTANAVSGGTGFLTNYDYGIEGYQAGSLPSTTFPDALAGSDAVVIDTTSNSSGLTVQSHNPSSAQINLVGTHPYPAGTVMMIVDANCSNRGIFVMTGPTNTNANAGNVVHNTGKTFNYGAGGSIGNCTKALKGDFDCSNQANASQTAYSPGSTLYTITSIGYYVRDPAQDNTISSPTLYRVEFASQYGSSSNTVQPLVEGISNLTITYGVKDSSGNIQYKDASAISGNTWKSVVVVKLQVTAQSLTKADNGNPVSRVFSRTVMIRNRS